MDKHSQFQMGGPKLGSHAILFLPRYLRIVTRTDTDAAWASVRTSVAKYLAGDGLRIAPLLQMVRLLHHCSHLDKRLVRNPG